MEVIDNNYHEIKILRCKILQYKIIIVFLCVFCVFYYNRGINIQTFEVKYISVFG